MYEQMLNQINIFNDYVHFVFSYYSLNMLLITSLMISKNRSTLHNVLPNHDHFVIVYKIRLLGARNPVIGRKRAIIVVPEVGKIEISSEEKL